MRNSSSQKSAILGESVPDYRYQLKLWTVEISYYSMKAYCCYDISPVDAALIEYTFKFFTLLVNSDDCLD